MTDIQFSTLMAMLGKIDLDVIWLTSTLVAMLGGMVIFGFWSGWRSTK